MRLSGFIKVFFFCGHYVRARNLTVEADFSVSNLVKVGQLVPELIQLMDAHMQLQRERG